MNAAIDTIEAPRPCRGEPALARVTAAGNTLLTGVRQLFVADSDQASGVTERLLEQYGGYCEALFEQLATDAPTELMDLVRFAGLRPAKLTYAAEALGSTGRAEAVSILIEILSSHPSALVREGAIFGVLKASTTSARPTLERLALSDPSAAVREAASSALELI